MSGNAEFEWKGLSQRVQFEFKIVFEFDMKGVEIEPRLHVQQGGATQIHPPPPRIQKWFPIREGGVCKKGRDRIQSTKILQSFGCLKNLDASKRIPHCDTC